MTLKTIYIARHGYRSNWLPGTPPPPPTGVNSDFTLAPHGENQAKELAHYMISIEPQPEMIFSSPFYRCLQTSQPLAQLLDIPVLLERGIGEWYKPDRDVIPVPASFEVLKNYFPELSDAWDNVVVPSDKGETEDEIFERCGQFWRVFFDSFGALYPDVETILLVTHAASKIALGMNLLGMSGVRAPVDEEGGTIRSGACSLDKYELNGDRWKMTMNGNTEFLSNGEEMHWDFANGFEAGSDADIQARKAAAVVSEEADMEHVYVTMELPLGSEKIAPTSTMQFVGTDKPLIKVGEQIYEGEWKKLVGTEVMVDQDDVHAVRDRLVLHDVTPM